MSILRQLIVLSLLSACFGIPLGLLSVWMYNQTGRWNPALETSSIEDYKKQQIVADERAKAFLPYELYDFGVFDREKEGTHDFVIENRGEADLTLQVNRTSCTCTGVQLSRDRIPPGEKGTITVHWKSDTPAPTFKQGASILTNDPNKLEIFLTVKGLFTFPMMIVPSSFTFPPLPVGKEGIGSFRVYGFEKERLEITQIAYTDREHFEVFQEPSELKGTDLTDPVLQKATNVIQVNIKVKPGLPLGVFQERLVFQTNYEQEEGIEYFVRGTIQGEGLSISGKDYSVATGILNLGKTGVSQPIRSNFIVRYIGSAPSGATLKLRSVEPAFLNVTVRGLQQQEATSPDEKRSNQADDERESVLPLKAAPTFFCTVEGMSETAGSWSGSDPEKSGSIEFETGLPDLPLLHLPIHLQIEAAQPTEIEPLSDM
ncbi:MAG: DUF1573 domain-containing protein [Thermoguttaceae bacterium]